MVLKYSSRLCWKCSSIYWDPAWGWDKIGPASAFSALSWSRGAKRFSFGDRKQNLKSKQKNFNHYVLFRPHKPISHYTKKNCKKILLPTEPQIYLCTACFMDFYQVAEFRCFLWKRKKRGERQNWTTVCFFGSVTEPGESRSWDIFFSHSRLESSLERVVQNYYFCHCVKLAIPSLYFKEKSAFHHHVSPHPPHHHDYHHNHEYHNPPPHIWLYRLPAGCGLTQNL